MPDENPDATGARPDLSALTRAAGDALSVRRVFGEAYEVGGTVVVPVAKVLGSHALAGAHGDGRLGVRKPAGPADASPTPGDEPAAHLPGPARRGPQWPFGPGRPAGRGGAHADTGGFAVRVKPVGVYVISGTEVTWKPALDLNRVILGGQAVGAVVGTAVGVALALAWGHRRR